MTGSQATVREDVNKDGQGTSVINVFFKHHVNQSSFRYLISNHARILGGFQMEIYT